jgi:hypothetical protein
MITIFIIAFAKRVINRTDKSVYRSSAAIYFFSKKSAKLSKMLLNLAYNFDILIIPPKRIK